MAHSFLPLSGRWRSTAEGDIIFGMLSASRRVAPCAVLTYLLFCSGGGAQTPPAKPSSADPVISSTSQEVLLDVVVRDKRGRPIKDLKVSDFSITDDGAAQTIRSFRLQSGPETVTETATAPAVSAPTAAGAPPRPTIDPLRQIRLVTLAFERLGPEARVNAGKAVEELLKSDDSANLIFAVFSIDQRLSVLQQYTNDRDRIRKAMGKITSSSSSLYKNESDLIEEELKVESTQAAAGAAVPTNSNGAPDGGAAAAGAMAQMTLDMLQFNQTLDQQQRGRSTIFALKSLIEEQYRLPGRKTVLYFTEGITVPPEYTDEFERIIGAANRFNVSVYGIDSRGLTTYSQNAGASSLLRQSANSTQSQQLSQRVGPVTRDQATAGDRSEESIRANTQNSLSDLSEKTGGFLIANSNDLKGQLRRVTEDIDTHYEISYSPAIEKFDGHFRKITVKLDRADARVQTRSGYFALPFTQGHIAATWELSMLNALTVNPLPRAIPFRAGALRFQNSAGGVDGGVVIDLPLEGIQFDRDEAAKAYRVHFSVMAVIRNSGGAIERKLSQDVPRQGPIDKIDAFRAGHFIYSQHVPLAPGRYTLEAVVSDSNSGRTSVKKQALVVPQPPKGPGISSIALVRSVAQTASLMGETASTDPFEFSGGKVTPSLNDTLKREDGGTVSFYLTVYPQAAVKTPPVLTLEFLLDGKVVGRAEPPLPPVDQTGRIPYIASSPLEAFKPGTYEVRATVRQEGLPPATERTLITIE